MRLNVVCIPSRDAGRESVDTNDLEEERAVVGMFALGAEEDGIADSGEKRAEDGKHGALFVSVRYPSNQETEDEGTGVWWDRQELGARSGEAQGAHDSRGEVGETIQLKGRDFSHCVLTYVAELTVTPLKKSGSERIMTWGALVKTDETSDQENTSDSLPSASASPLQS